QPNAPIRGIERRYRAGTMILETEFTCDGGVVRIVDFMPLGRHSLVRIVEGVEGEVPIEMFLGVRFGYGAYRPWVRSTSDGDIELTAAPDSLALRTPARCQADERDVRASFTVRKGDRVPFELAWYPSHETEPARVDPFA